MTHNFPRRLVLLGLVLLAGLLACFPADAPPATPDSPTATGVQPTETKTETATSTEQSGQGSSSGGDSVTTTVAASPTSVHASATTRPTDTASPIPTETASPQPKPTRTAPPPTPEPTRTPLPPTAEPAACGTQGNAGFESTLINLINQARGNQGLGTLSAQTQLSAAARSHSIDMACNDFVSHTGSDGSTPFGRIAAQGYSYSAAAENVYAGSGSLNTPQQAFQSWLNSSGHKANMLNDTYTHVGVGYMFYEDSSYGGYFTAVFAKP